MNQAPQFVSSRLGSTDDRSNQRCCNREDSGHHSQIEQLANRLMAAIPLSSRLRRRFWNGTRFFQESEAWSLEQVHEFQFSRLRNYSGS